MILLKKGGEQKAIYSDKPFVFVTPIYTGRIPKVVERYIKGLSLEGRKKAYFITTCAQTPYNAQAYVERLCEEKGIELKGFAAVIMPQCYIIQYQPPSKSEADEIIKRSVPQMMKISKDIMAGKTFVGKSNGGKFMSAVVNPMFYSLFVSAKGFYATDRCNGCGGCVRRCPLNNIELRNGRPWWGLNCTHCMSCIDRCPQEAIEFKNKTNGKRRYHNDKVAKETLEKYISNN